MHEKKKTIIVRKLESRDLTALYGIIADTWSFNKVFGDKYAMKVAKAYLDIYLAEQTFVRVAEIVNDFGSSNVTAGAILGNISERHTVSFRDSIRSMASKLTLRFSRPGRDALKAYKSLQEYNDELYEKVNTDYEAELVLFFVNQNLRGSGCGRILLQSLLQYMKESGVKRMCVFTDSICNTGFYDYFGFTRKSEKMHKLEVGNMQFDIEFYLYDLENIDQ